MKPLDLALRPVLDNLSLRIPAGLAWLLPRLQHAKGLRIDDHHGMLENLETRHLHGLIAMLLKAPSLSELHALVSYISEPWLAPSDAPDSERVSHNTALHKLRNLLAV